MDIHDRALSSGSTGLSGLPQTSGATRGERPEVQRMPSGLPDSQWDSDPAGAGSDHRTALSGSRRSVGKRSDSRKNSHSLVGREALSLRISAIPCSFWEGAASAIPGWRWPKSGIPEGGLQLSLFQGVKNDRRPDRRRPRGGPKFGTRIACNLIAGCESNVSKARKGRR